MKKWTEFLGEIKILGNKVKAKKDGLLHQWVDSSNRHSKVTGIITRLMIAFICGVWGASLGQPAILLALIMFALGFIAITIAFYILDHFLRFLFRFQNLVPAIHLLLLAVAILFISGYKSANFLKLALFTLVIYWLFYLAAYLVERRHAYKKCSFIVVASIETLLLGAIIVFFIYTGGYPEPQMTANLPGKGAYTACCVDYGPNSRLNPTDFGGIPTRKTRLDEIYPAGLSINERVDLSKFVDGYKGITKWYRELILDYSIDEVPLSGRVWYPEETNNCPTLFIVHGNHNFLTESYKGYDYLGEYLASYGYVVISVDENSVNTSMMGGLKEENDARAILLLDNIKAVLEDSTKEYSTIYGKIDPDRIAIMGHSRGGEMVADAYLFNQYQTYPGNANIKFDYGFNISGVIAVSPTANQYRPADSDVVIEDVNYLLIHGNRDQDVYDVDGKTQYGNVNFTGEKDCFKASVIIDGANHGQFNSLWERYDVGAPFSWFLYTGDIMNTNDQKTILKNLVLSFLKVTFNNDEEEETVFCQGIRTEEYPWCGYYQTYQNSKDVVLANFDEDTNPSTGSNPSIVCDAEHMTVWQEKNINGQVVLLKWDRKEDNGLQEYRLLSDGIDITNQFVCVDICGDKINDTRMIVSMVLIDEDGNDVKVNARDYVNLLPPVETTPTKMDYLFRNGYNRTYFQTIRIPCTAFSDQNQQFQSDHVVKIGICFEDSDCGQVLLDNFVLEPMN